MQTQAKIREVIKQFAAMTEAECEKENLAGLAVDLGVTLEQLIGWIKSARDLKRDVPSVVWRNSTDQVVIEHRPSIVDKLIYRGTSILLIGKPKCGKTTFALDASDFVIRGESFLKEVVTPGHILYVSEQGVASFAAEMQNSGLTVEVQGTLQENPPKQFHYLCVEDWFKLGGWANIVNVTLEHALEVGASLVVFDTVTRLAGLEDENSASEMVAALSKTNPLMAAGVTVLFLMHERKSGGSIEDSGRGSNAAAGFVDVILRLTRADAKLPFSHRALEVIGRFGGAERIIDRKTSDSGSRYLLMGETSTVKSLSTRQVIMDLFIQDDTNLTREEIEEATTLKKTGIRRALERLVESGRLTMSGAGKRNRPAVYQQSESEIKSKANPPF